MNTEAIIKLIELAAKNNWAVTHEKLGLLPEYLYELGCTSEATQEDLKEFEEDYPVMMFTFRKDGTTLTYGEDDSYSDHYDAYQHEPDELEVYWRDLVGGDFGYTIMGEEKWGSIRKPTPDLEHAGPLASEETIRLLQARIRELEGTPVPHWSPVGGGWWITSNNDIVPVTTSINCEMATLFGTRRPTKEQAERAAIEMRKFNRLLALRDELCNGEVPDWFDTTIDKYSIAFDYDNGVWAVSMHSRFQSIQPCFTTREAAKIACKMLNSREVEL
jgi:hypothetical protein